MTEGGRNNGGVSYSDLRDPEVLGTILSRAKKAPDPKVHGVEAGAKQISEAVHKVLLL